MADYPISNVPRRVVYAASGTGPYAFTFEILSETDIDVYKADVLLTLTTDYTVTINPNGTGTVTLVATAGTSNITIVGGRTVQRTTDFVTGGDFFANTLNDELDSQTIFIQQIAETAERGLKAPVTDPTDINMTLPDRVERAGKYLVFDVNGNPAPGEIPEDVAIVSANIDDVIAVAAIDAAVSTVAANDANITVVAGITSDLAVVGAIGADVTTVAGIAADVTAVAGNATDISTVAGITADVSAVAAVDSEIAAVGADLAGPDTIGTVAANLLGTDTIGAVAAIAAEVDTVAGISADVTAVAADATDIGTVATNIANVNTVAGISANVTTVAGISADVTAVAGDAADIGAVAANITNVNAVAANATNINAVAANETNINAVAADATDIGLVAGSIANVNTVAANITNVNTVAGLDTEITALGARTDEIDALYAEIGNIATKVSKTSDTGSAVLPVGTEAQRDASPSAGFLRFNSDSDEFEGYNGTAWSSVGGSAITNDTATSTDVFPLFADATSGTASSVFTSDAKLLYKPSTGEFKAEVLVAQNGLVVNSATIDTSYSIPSGSNAMSAGPVSVDSGVTITVPSGSVWTIV
jgi:hypothetical protein